VGAGVAPRGAETAGLLQCVFTCAGGESARRGESRIMVTFTGIGTDSLCSSSDSRCTSSEGQMHEEGTHGRGENTFYIEITYCIPDYIPGHGARCAGPSSRGPDSSTYTGREHIIYVERTHSSYQTTKLDVLAHLEEVEGLGVRV
jgi:hypothetical protein